MTPDTAGPPAAVSGLTAGVTTGHAAGPTTGEGVGPAALLDALGLIPGQRWQDQALCAQVDPELFFPEKGGTTRPAKQICASCEVRFECLEYALEREERFGIWGGLSERERRRLKRHAA